MGGGAAAGDGRAMACDDFPSARCHPSGTRLHGRPWRSWRSTHGAAAKPIARARWGGDGGQRCRLGVHGRRAMAPSSGARRGAHAQSSAATPSVAALSPISRPYTPHHVRRPTGSGAVLWLPASPPRRPPPRPCDRVRDGGGGDAAPVGAAQQRGAAPKAPPWRPRPPRPPRRLAWGGSPPRLVTAMASPVPASARPLGRLARRGHCVRIAPLPRHTRDRWERASPAEPRSPPPRPPPPPPPWPCSSHCAPSVTPWWGHHNTPPQWQQ